MKWKTEYMADFLGRPIKISELCEKKVNQHIGIEKKSEGYS